MIYTNSTLDRLIDGFFTAPTFSSVVSNKPTQQNYQINYTKDGAYLLFEVPGFNNSNLKVEMEDGVLYIDGKRTYKLNGEDTEKVISQKFTIGKEYNTEAVEATIEDGILTVYVANYKKTEKKKRVSLL
jgi:HSP20 family molecular chaperone IbpA